MQKGGSASECRLAPLALEMLVDLVDRLALFSEGAAGRFARQAMENVDRLELFPELGRTVPEFDDPRIREVFVGRYRLIYRLTDEVVQVLLVWNSAMPLD